MPKIEILIFLTALLFFFIVGAIAPLIPYVITKKWPNSVFKYVK